AMLEATDHAEPRAVMASGFVTLDGKGFSTSRDRAVWADEYLDEGFHPDPLRYYLATNGGFQQDVDFSWEKFAERVNTELVGTVGNFLYRSLLFAHRNYEDGPDADAPSDDVAARIDEAVDEFAAAVNDYSVRALGDAAPGREPAVLEYLSAFRYALAGEFAATSDLVSRLRVQ
ncbi:class I tRNA ligase family protein, partial [Halobellus sp. Atlit-38R]|uniref:class I tRNA ligase family protein n=1 Tax=Halobellus sp. Atlit-38R TaxID=2282131 RepID=UPI001F375507